MPTFRHYGETKLVVIPWQKQGDAAVMMGMKVYPGLWFFRCEWAASCEDTSTQKIDGADARYYIYDRERESEDESGSDHIHEPQSLT